MNTKFKNIIRFTLLSVMVIVGAASGYAEETAASLLGRCAKKIQGASSVSATFSMTASGHSSSGTLLTKGSKFAISLPGVGTWYDGTNMWSYLKANGEATLWNPTRGELAESNPLLYISSSKDYDVKYGSSSAKGSKTLILTPKKRGTGVKSVTITVLTSTLLPQKIVVAASSGNCTFVINSIKLNTSIADSNFKFDSSKYKGVKVNDLR